VREWLTSAEAVEKRGNRKAKFSEIAKDNLERMEHSQYFASLSDEGV
jgi:hypothetical protein